MRSSDFCRLQSPVASPGIDVKTGVPTPDDPLDILNHTSEDPAREYASTPLGAEYSPAGLRHMSEEAPRILSIDCCMLVAEWALLTCSLFFCSSRSFCGCAQILISAGRRTLALGETPSKVASGTRELSGPIGEECACSSGTTSCIGSPSSMLLSVEAVASSELPGLWRLLRCRTFRPDVFPSVGLVPKLRGLCD